MRDDRPLLGYTVGVTAVRHAWEFGTALEHRGARVVYAPAMRMIPPAEDAALHDATKRCLAEPVEVAVATTPAALHGEPLPDLVDALRCAGAEVVEATVFSWAPPSGRALEELGALWLLRVIESTSAGISRSSTPCRSCSGPMPSGS